MISKILVSFFSLAAVVLASCTKEPSFDYPEGTVGSSRVTNFAKFDVSGTPVMSIVMGSTFTDPGVKAKEGETEIPVTVTGSVNPNTVGLYTLTYSATNKDGFTATSERIVVVLPAAEQDGIDLSGEYLPIGGAPSNATITKVAKGVYYTTNCWGGGSLAVIPAYFICVDGSTVIIPEQDPGSGRIVTQSPGTYSGGMITWTVIRLDFPGGPLVRTKQWQKL